MQKVAAVLLAFSSSITTLSAPPLMAADPPSAPPRHLKLGDPMVDGSFLKPYKNAWKIVYAFPGKEPFLVGTWSDELSQVTVGERHLLKRAQSADYSKYHIITTNTNVFDPKTMAPVTMDFTRSDTGEWAHRDFAGRTVKYQRKKTAAEAAPAAGTLTMEEPIFDFNGGMYGLLLAATPLAEGLTASLPALSEDTDQFEKVTFKVGKEELIDAGPGKQVMAWPVDVDADYANQSHSIFWISKEPPYIIKLVTIIPKGRWVTVTISMI